MLPPARLSLLIYAVTLPNILPPHKAAVKHSNNKNTGRQAAISRTRFFAVNILDEGQADLAYQSAKPQTDKFQGIEAQQRKVRRSLLNCSGQGEQWIVTMKKKANGSALIASSDWEIRS